MSTIATNLRVYEPTELPGLAGWLTTSDHKRIGRCWIAVSLAALLVGLGLLLAVAAEGTESGQQILDGGSFARIYSAYHEVLVLGFLVPFAIGLATYLIPLQIGAPGLAFPRMASFAFWTYVVALGSLVGAYLARGGAVASSGRAADLYVVAFAGVVAALSVALASIISTAATWRTSGLTLDRAPAFTWATIVGGGLFILSASVLLSRLILGYIASRYGDGVFDYPTVSWFWSGPQLGLLAVPTAGIALDLSPTLAKARFRVHGTVLVVLAAMAILGFGAGSQLVDTFDDVFYVLVSFAEILPALVVVALLGDLLRRGRPSGASALVMALVASVLLLGAAAAGAAGAISGLDLQGTVWADAIFALVVPGAGLLGVGAALWYWAPKLYGLQLSEAAGKVVALFVSAGTVFYALPVFVNGLVNDVPLAATGWDGSDIADLNRLSLLGIALVALGAVLIVVELVRSVVLRQGFRAGADPWHGATLEWAAASPPSAFNFAGPLPEVHSAWPLWADESDGSSRR